MSIIIYFYLLIYLVIVISKLQYEMYSKFKIKDGIKHYNFFFVNWENNFEIYKHDPIYIEFKIK